MRWRILAESWHQTSDGNGSYFYCTESLDSVHCSPTPWTDKQPDDPSLSSLISPEVHVHLLRDGAFTDYSSHSFAGDAALLWVVYMHWNDKFNYTSAVFNTGHSHNTGLNHIAPVWFRLYTDQLHDQHPLTLSRRVCRLINSSYLSSHSWPLIVVISIVLTHPVHLW